MNVGEALRQRNHGRGDRRHRANTSNGGGDADVAVGKDGHSFCVDIVVHLASGPSSWKRRGQGGDAHAAFDEALIKLETRVRRYKRRLKNHHTHPGGRAATAEMASLIVLRADDEGDFDEAWGGRRTCRRSAGRHDNRRNRSHLEDHAGLHGGDGARPVRCADGAVPQCGSRWPVGGLPAQRTATSGWIDPERMPP